MNPYSKEFQLRGKTKKEPKPLKQVGKKTKVWNDARAELKIKFAKMGITECEVHLDGICWKKNALTFAHIDKRRNLTADEVKTAVVLACTPCHMKIEALPHEQMRKMLEKIIKDRK